MRGIKRGGVVLTAVVAAALLPVLAHAAEIIIKRDVPVRSAVHTAPPGPASAVQTERRDMILGLVPDGKLLNDDEVASVLGSGPGSVNQAGRPGGVQTYLDRPAGDASSSVAASGMGSFSSLGGRISNEVNRPIGAAMQNLTNALAPRPGQ
jgi:hypothetical protein